MQIYIVTLSIYIVSLHSLNAALCDDIGSLPICIVALSLYIGTQWICAGTMSIRKAAPQLLVIAVTIGIFIQTVCSVAECIVTETDSVFLATQTVVSLAVSMLHVVQTICIVPGTINDVPATARETIVSIRIGALQSYKETGISARHDDVDKAVSLFVHDHNSHSPPGAEIATI